MKTRPANNRPLLATMTKEPFQPIRLYYSVPGRSGLEQPRTDIDVASLEEFHLAAFDDLFAGARDDDYLLAGHRYWACIYLCPYADCDCHKVRVAFFADNAKPGSGDTVGSRAPRRP